MTALAVGRDWWLPVNYSVHGRSIDALFSWIFWTAAIALLAVQIVLATALLKFRHRSHRPKAHFTHGNPTIEIIWTAIPAGILLALAVASKQVWDRFRYSPDFDDPARSKVLVIAQQFKWNIIYPGPDGKFGRYLQFPKPTDPAWPTGEDGRPARFAGVPGPASLPRSQAIAAINQYIDVSNPLGKDFSDPDGLDDDYQSALARTLYLPVNRPVEIDVESKDVIHDFYLPNFRVQVYAVPGTLNRFVFTPTITTAELESASRRSYAIDDLAALLAQPAYRELTIDIDSNSPGAVHDKFGWRYVDDPTAKNPRTIIRNGMPFPPDSPAKLKAAGIRIITAHLPGYCDIACAQLCGLGHYTMQGKLVVLSQEEFDRRFPAAPHRAD